MTATNSLNIAFDQIADALAAIRNGECVVVVDDESRENEGDLICAAQFATPQQINFMATEARGLICLAMDGERLDQLDLPLMVDRNTDSNQTAFTVSIDAGPEYGVSTGISAEDRARTIQVAINPQTKPNRLRRPGHVFPLRANKGGVLKRAGHTEAAVDLSLLSGLSAAGVICEIQNADGSMARLPELTKYAKTWGLKIISIADLIRFRLENERFVYRKAKTRLPSIFGDFQAIGYTNELDGTEHIALVKGNINELKEPVLVRMHSECLTGDAFGSLRCDCRPQLEAALNLISEEGEGVVVYLRQEGRGIGLINKLKAYSLQDGGLDTVEANLKLGFAADLRNYGVGAQILTDLGINRLRLLTNNPRKIAGLGGYGLRVESREPLVINPTDYNANYLAIKRTKLGHYIGNDDDSGKYYVIYWKGIVSSNMLSAYKNKAEQIASDNKVELNPESSSRLLALLQRPQFVWRVQNCIDFESIINLLKEIIKWDGTKSIGIFITNSKEQAIHPSQDVETILENISNLKDTNYKNIANINDKDLPFIMTWQ
ncbi:MULTISPECIES: bifunctional 3,4-dihydroxy-2-butanone-4-phosphate synthase/GTP cyclohydrolase II [Prochlorococcus]|uniref:Riboflavin biosynthesis protein RibBA n=1 Tax=Prochlorococcus marinus (strain SARG / CCMP1375 / SS120) TaxID=167539 RepID=Q7VBZ9_PROMA|nr:MULTISPECIES: bifunctional 3,4-dihydroxy-2-butanone-4-phosphate synthase/GTP cyclohydrolase II [Prochlorococcus]AAP99987.1 3,4-dihydroxy-2-butanone 4-phosphate synthase [Prochlorococcus marinus subsp. marinus str. CCMP1375]KGG13785.1 3,4-dihydroxy-2-butanone 4-phosphate synthase [Prochlorococcus marinus str. LG]KGG18920.1 3,4-dihydroxy-2-butanone 4-phosphate synthase [Prochlorococcus marinus str. SS2]KGG23542.1 3,4-dihydroxy-2-butanone 4-phosphate synthase [Prochlorococcus marinus str. SS35]